MTLSLKWGQVTRRNVSGEWVNTVALQRVVVEAGGAPGTLFMMH